MRIIVFGAAGRVGSRTVAEALARGHEVTAVVRDPEHHTLPGDGLNVVAGDATDPASVAEVRVLPTRWRPSRPPRAPCSTGSRAPASRA